MRGSTFAAAAVALAAGVSAAPQNIDVKVKTTQTTTVQTVTKYATETDKRITTVFDTVYLTQTQKAVTTTYISTSTVTSGTAVLPTVTKTVTVGGCSSGTGSSSTSVASATTMTTTELARQANPTAISTHGLADIAAALNPARYFGTAVDYPGTGEGSDPVYMAVATDKHEFDQWTPANIMKYEFTEPSQGVFNFT